MKIKHHPDVSMLMSCAAGSQPEAMAAVMASHLAICPSCVSEVKRMEKIGAALFAGLEPSPVVGSAAAALGAREADDDSTMVRTAGKTACTFDKDSAVPYPLRQIVGRDFENVPWKWLAPGVWHIPIKLSDDADGGLRLIKVAPGNKLPMHSHSGEEVSLVLQGSYRDETGHYGVGDVADLDESDEHSPVACEKEGCICLIATEGPAKFKSMLARLIQPLTGM